jgi:hypothetical protein
MAFTTTEKYKLVRLLGWEAKVLDDTSTVYNSVVNDRLEGYATDAENEVRTLLDRIVTLDEKLEKATCRVSTKEVDGVVLNEDEIPALRRERTRVIREISEFLGIPYRRSGGVMGNVCI